MLTKLDIADFLYHTSGLPFSTLAYLEQPSPDTIEQQLQDAIATLITQPFNLSATVAVAGKEPIVNKTTG